MVIETNIYIIRYDRFEDTIHINQFEIYEKYRGKKHSYKIFDDLESLYKRDITL